MSKYDTDLFLFPTTHYKLAQLEYSIEKSRIMAYSIPHWYFNHCLGKSFPDIPDPPEY